MKSIVVVLLIWMIIISLSACTTGVSSIEKDQQRLVTQTQAIQTTVTLQDETPTCDQVLDACDKALSDSNKQIEVQEKIIKKQDETIKEQDSRIEELEDNSNKNLLLTIGSGLLSILLLIF